MSGVPVVISENGLGVPVHPVDDGAPVMTVATNGLGMPIVITDKGAPFIVQGLNPTFNPVTALSPGAAVLAVYDPSDLSTMFQDRAGTVPVTAPGQLVGVIRDKGPGGFHRTAINDAARGTYQSDGVRHWIVYDGLNTCYSTATITPGVDKVQVFAGVRKLSDAAAGLLVEFSAAYATNSGVFTINAPTGATQATYGWGSKGISSAFFTSPATFGAPITSVLTGLGDIAGDTSILRINGTQSATSTVDQGTGNYGPHQLFFGRRGGTSLPFNGLEYASIVRFSGANLSADLIAQTERWIANKAGVAI